MIESVEITQKLSALTNWFKENYNFDITGLDWHQKTISGSPEIYQSAYAAWCFLSIIKGLGPSTVFTTRFAASNDTDRFWDHLYRREFINEEKFEKTSEFPNVVFQSGRIKNRTRPKFFSGPSLVEELLPFMIANVEGDTFSFWFNQQLIVDTTFADPNQLYVSPDIQIRNAGNIYAWCKVLPGEQDQFEINIGTDTAQTKGFGKKFGVPGIYYGGYIDKKPIAILCKPRVEKIKLDIRDELKELVQLIGVDQIFLITEHEIWKKYFQINLEVPVENICMDNRWNDDVINAFIDRHRKKFGA